MMTTSDLRSDARRNREVVLDAAARVLNAVPAASTQEIAAAAGVGRATIYRHFGSRVGLVAALLERGSAESLEIVRECVALDRPALEIQAELIRRHIELGDRYRFAMAHPGEAREHAGSAEAVYIAFVGRAQEAGEIRADLTPEWIARAVSAILETAHVKCTTGELTLDAAADVAIRTVTPMLAPSPR